VSHLTVSPIKILEIDALRRAAQSFGAQFAEKKTFHSYQGDSKCEYVIALPQVNYEIGIVRNKDNSFSLSHDPYGHSGSHHDGHKLVERFGKNLGLLSQAYSRQVVMAQARKKGFMITERRLPSGELRLQLLSV